MPSRRTFCCKGYEYEEFVKHVEGLQEYVAICSNESCPLTVRTRSTLYFSKESNGPVKIDSLDFCRKCELYLNQKSPFIFVQVGQNSGIYFQEIPKNLFFNGLKYTLLCCTTFDEAFGENSAHYRGIFLLEDQLFCIDDLHPLAYEEHFPNVHQISTCCYILS